MQVVEPIANETQDVEDVSCSTLDTPSIVSLSDGESSECGAPSCSVITDSFASQLSELFGPPDMAFAPTSVSMNTYKLVGDNLDKNVKPCDMRIDNQTKSLHYFHMYALRDRIDLSSYEGKNFTTNIADIDLNRILPTQGDAEAVKANFSILVARVLKKHMSFFKKYGSGLEAHIRHKYYYEMSAKSEIVS